MTAITTTVSSLDMASHGLDSSYTKDSYTPNNLSQSNGYTASSNISKSTPLKLRHVAAVHSKNRTSCLSHDSAETPSFLGFRNLMVIVLSTYPSVFDICPQNLVDDLIAIVVMNLRLVIENFQKARNHGTTSSMQQANNVVSMVSSSVFDVMITVVKTFYSVSSSTPQFPVICLWPTSSSLPLPIKLEALSVVPNAGPKIHKTVLKRLNLFVPPG